MFKITNIVDVLQCMVVRNIFDVMITDDANRKVSTDICRHSTVGSATAL